MSLPTPVSGLRLADEGPLLDGFARRHTYLRVSVTDRCNYRCTYCMPEQGLDWQPREELLSFEEIARLVSIFVRLGVRRVRLTGGEPLIRRGLHHLVAMLSELGLEDLAMTTNAHLLARHADQLARAGLDRVNVSCDAVDPDIFRRTTRNGDLAAVFEGIEAARAAGLTPIKINAVVVAGVNEHQVVPMVEHFAPHAEDTVVRFIEYMPFGRSLGAHVPVARLRETLQDAYTLEPIGRGGGGPAVAWRVVETGQQVGFI